jgi:hypothetical protein
MAGASVYNLMELWTIPISDTQEMAALCPSVRGQGSA